MKTRYDKRKGRHQERDCKKGKMRRENGEK